MKRLICELQKQTHINHDSYLDNNNYQTLIHNVQIVTYIITMTTSNVKPLSHARRTSNSDIHPIVILIRAPVSHMVILYTHQWDPSSTSIL